MERMKMHSRDNVARNIEAVGQLFPNALTEVMRDGKVVQAIDFDMLRQELAREIVEGREERYAFTWPDKRQAILAANAPIAMTLRPVVEDSVGRDGTAGAFDSENLYIEGDNLDVLKLLQETYLGKVKMIYIDPPYNTGNDAFVYDDDFAMEGGDFVSANVPYDEHGNMVYDFKKNLDSNGRFHTDWLNMIYPRLKVAKSLLADDGVIFISIDDNEVENLKKICNEIYGEANFVGCVILQTATDNNPSQINTEHEYTVCYAKVKPNLNAWFSINERAGLIQEKYNELRTLYHEDIITIQKELRTWIRKNSDNLKGVTHYDNVDEKGVFHDGDVANTAFGGYKYTVLHPVTKKPCKIPEKGFRFPEATMCKMIEHGEIMFGEDETTLIKPKKRLEAAKDVLRSVIYEDGRASTKQFESLMTRDIFQNPKSPMILERLIRFLVKEGDLILDFFSGTGTTAEAVMHLNSKRRLGIKYIMVQLPENLDESIVKSDSRAKKTLHNAISFLDNIELPHTICEIGKERIRRAGAKIAAEAGEKAAGLDRGFRCLRLDTSNMTDVYYVPDAVTQDGLFAQVDNVKADRTPEDLLVQTMLDLGILLSAPITVEEIAGKRVFNVADGFLLACFDRDVTDETVTAIAKRKPYYAVFRDASMADDSALTNFDQLFAAYSPATVRRVL